MRKEQRSITDVTEHSNTRISTSIVTGLAKDGRARFVVLVAALALFGSGCGGSTSGSAANGQGNETFDPLKVTVSEPPEARQEIPLSRTIGSDRRKAVFFEAFYALREGWLSPPHESGPFGGNQINGAVVGDWSYLASDTNALNHVISRIGRSNASISSESMTSPSYTMKNGFERAGQCLFFTALILRRSLSYDLPVAWASYPNNGPSAREAVPGDVVYYKRSTGNHIGIVVLTTADGIDVVDSNFVGYGTHPIVSGQSSSEVIGRHWLSNSAISSGGWMVYKGAGRWY